jgi:hypothetical protein
MESAGAQLVPAPDGANPLLADVETDQQPEGAGQPITLETVYEVDLPSTPRGG